MLAVVTVQTYAKAKIIVKVVASTRQDRHSRDGLEWSSVSHLIRAYLFSLETCKTRTTTRGRTRCTEIHSAADAAFPRPKISQSQQLSIRFDRAFTLHLRSVVSLQPLPGAISTRLCMSIPTYLSQIHFRTSRL